MEQIACYCQNCREANQLGETKCRNCGTRLLLVVFPQSLKFDTNHVPSYYEDHLLERVTSLELRLAQVTEQLAMACELIKRETAAGKKERDTLETFFKNLETANPELSETLNRRTVRLATEPKEKSDIESKIESKKEAALREIVSFYDGRQIELFTHLVREGFRLLQADEEKLAFQTLERAVLISRGNLPLHLLIAKNLFRRNKLTEAGKHLEKALELDAQNEKVLLLLGAIYADDKKAKKSRKLLSLLVDNRQTGSLVNYIWAMLAAFEENWTESLAAFKQCLPEAESPEIYYLIGCVNFQLQSWEKSLSYLQKAVVSDSKFADAHFMQSVVYQILNQPEKAEAAVKSALDVKETGAQCLEFLSRQKEANVETALPFLHLRKKEKHLLSDNSPRLQAFLRRQILKVID